MEIIDQTPNLPMLKATIQDLCEHRDRYLAEMQDRLRKVALCKAGAPAGVDGLEYREFDPPKPEELRKRVDRGLWHHAMKESRLRQLMTRNKYKEFYNEIESAKCPEFTAANVMATMQSLIAQGPELLAESVIGLFRSLSGEYKSNDPFKIPKGKRFVVKNVVQNYGTHHLRCGSMWTYGGQYIDDLQRIREVLEGRDDPTYDEKLSTQIERAASEDRLCSRLELSWVKIRWFANGNAHLWVGDHGFIDRCNKIIAAHYGKAIGARHNGNAHQWQAYA